LTGKDSYESAMEEFEKEIGFKYLKAVHLNDSGG
jgi:endonuclease IV